MSVKPLTEHHLEFQSLKGVCTGSSESTLVKIPHCWKSHIMSHLSSEVEVWSISFDCRSLEGYSEIAHFDQHSLVLEHDASFVDHLCYVCLAFVRVC